MAVRTGKSFDWRRAVAGAMVGGALATGLVVGAGAAPAWADPATDDVTAAPEMTADQALAIVASDYDMGAGGGQLSTLIHKVLKMRQQGYYPSSANKEAIVAALDKRPNQAPLVAALESTLTFQLRQAARGGGGGPVLNPPTIGIGGSGGNGAIDPNNSGGINIPLA
ncbi:hypothetical protein TUM20985_29540 [Mycobacterium antarcticum]|uniref:hypothetical protein n=1 Tax=unclassified Mycolicibacterium TaxID=2636767 RepID=UPI00238F407D|nr:MULTISPECIES: hypothetical protein [unclassified Mycolicibacterium]BDX32407.1 hypothetical protein TUM20985_29540 [Mycolicibacterium sp. TUM20985]GLP84052.1 hypothetical protein TUM20984_54720 [Mycolicibacterium sp. TUM20984]